jgi:hypothetical protein
MDVHISVIADFRSLGLDIEVTDWCLSGHAHVMKRPRDEPKHISARTWESMTPATIAAFQAEYDTFLSSFDGFVVGHAASFAMIYEKYKKPIIWINSCRMDLPWCFHSNMAMRTLQIECMKRLHDSGRLIAVSNNKADQEYTFRATGIRTQWIPSLCLYTKMTYSPVRPTFLCYTGTCPADPRITQKADLGHFEWNTIGEFKGIIHFPYEISTMSLFEQFTAGCPMFFPSKEYLHNNYTTLSSVSAYWGSRPVPEEYGDLNDVNTWIELADFYDTFKSPNTHYFDSIEHLGQLIDSFVYIDDREVRAQRTRAIQAKWATILQDIQSNPMRTRAPVHLCYNRLPVLANVVFDVQYGNEILIQHSYPTRHTLAPYDVVFVKTDLLDWFLANKSPNVPITLVTGASDLSPSPDASAAILSNPNIRRWIGCNIRERHPKIKKVLIGVGEVGRSNGNHEELKTLHASRPAWESKSSELCVPYHGNTHGGRTLAATIEKLVFPDYMRAIGAHKFVVSQRGNGLDTHRFSEILLMGSVPVVLHSDLDDLYEQFPCLIVDSFDSVDTSGFVWDDAKYERFLDMFWLRPAGVLAMLN